MLIVTALLVLNLALTGVLLVLELRDRGERPAIGALVPTTSPLPTPTVQPPTPIPTAPAVAAATATPVQVVLRGADIIDEALFAGGSSGTAVPQGTATGLSPPTPEEAQQVVQQYVDAFERDDVEGVRATTSGTARTQTDELIASIEQQERENGVDADLRVADLQLAPPVAEGSEQSVTGSFRVEAYVDTLVGELRVEDIPATADFKVGRVAEGVRIVRIEYEEPP